MEKSAYPPPHPTPHFIVENGLLYCVAIRRGEEKHPLVVLHTKMQMILTLVHSHPLLWHLGPENILQRIRYWFHWQGINAELRRFCKSCDMCQRTAPQKPPRAP